MPKPVIYYIRHGQTDWNAELRFQGGRDIPLNDKGRMQARRNGEKLRELLGEGEGFSFVSSPLGRTRETMEIVRLAMGLEPSDYEIDERLVEASFGDWEGTTLPEVKARFPDLHKQRKRERWSFAPPNGDSHQSILARVAEWYEGVDRPSIVTAHGLVGRVLRQHVLQLDTTEAAGFVFPQDKVCRLENNVETFV